MIAKRIKHGVVGGLVGGAVFGLMMAMMGMLPMIGKMVGLPNAAVGFLVHMMISAGIGGSFGVLAGPLVTGRLTGLLSGAAYGMVWWVLGPLTLMPLMMGMGTNWTLAAAHHMLPSLMGHMVFGLLLGLVYARAENCLLLKKADNSAKRIPLKAV